MSITAPVTVAPIYKDKVWGGHRLRSILGKDVAASRCIGESWELTDYSAQDQSVVDHGPLAGRSLHELMETAQEAFGVPIGGRFPLLYKFIDANDKLSLQVHPDDAYARAHIGPHANGKTECWYFVDADPDAAIIVGFNTRMSDAQLQRHIEDNTLPHVCNTLRVSAGDLVMLPAGTIHATLGGALFYEVQQTSDTTYRFYDWGRNQPDRPLHIAESLAVVDREVREGYRVAPVTIAGGMSGVTRRVRVACRYFALEEYIFDTAARVSLPPRKSFQVATLLRGGADFISSAGRLEARGGRTVLLPGPGASGQQSPHIEAGAGTHMLVSWQPDISAEVITPLRACGVSDKDILALGGPRAHNHVVPCV
jgi:mannose-6-phosphate isomerase